ncbi:lysine-type exporter protein (lyse/ygga) [Lucifera butyrica]|uniref:Lysine-type exporter protein (Lyse/ygga) n=1 Tax=Lucifera butyrica TaxID=1351585 RepID=A0A498RCQ4_9FIRM|nr:LysE family translocator [Lucifera butyrica]VBB09049.1 lysine-type exporter protein (lyse/ygga) [Lucifera butyrica]
MTDYTYWAMFSAAALAINISPGPDLMYILSRTLANGKNVGIASSAGVGAGALVHVSAAAFGLSTLLATSITAFNLVKYIGAAYLIYLGIKNWRCSGTHLDLAAKSVPGVSPWQAFKQGMLVDILNPKAAIFFMAFLPQFVRPEIASIPLQLFGLGTLVIIMGLVVETIFILLASTISCHLQKKNSVSKWLDRFLGSVFVGLGIRLALLDKA